MFRIPDLSAVVCNVYTNDGAGPPYPGLCVLRLVNEPCNLQAARRAQVMSTGGTTTSGVFEDAMYLLLRARTDVRGPVQYANLLLPGDVVEVPSGTGRFYWVTYVDDVGRGYANEFRFATLQMAQSPLVLT